MSATPAIVGSHEAHAEHAEVELSFAERLRNNRLGIWLFCFSEVFLFGGLLMARFYLWIDPSSGVIVRPDLNQTLGLITTSVLLVSSLFMVLAETSIAHGDRKGMLRNLMITGVLGVVFLIGVVGLEWGGEIHPGDGAFGAIFYGMTSLHALHVLSGVFLIFVIWWNGRKGKFSADDHWGVEATAIYWHFVDVVWVFFYPALYLIGQAVHIG